MATYVFSDLHGRKDLWLKANKEVFGPNDTIYFLGDAPDRGPDGWEMIKTLLDDERVIYLMGNHEDMLIKAIEENYDNLPLLYWNGGKNTYEGYVLDTKENQKKYLEKLKALPKHETYYPLESKNVLILSHAGTTPGRPIFDEDDWLWDREHLYDEWISDREDIFIIHGHTPVQNLVEYEGIVKPIRYCYGHKIDVDLGAFVSNKLGILNLDTFEEIIISIE
jgi:serine/threonine protein phosphatase 1